MRPEKSINTTSQGVAMVIACSPSGATAATHWKSTSNMKNSNRVHPKIVGKNS
eukprot:CAMPEP_0183405880 /NCGR_PEP_ID=MMETSP0370-20130417/16161_1 /TAXON_ID=268820 /ORGANISM="Peridinium aciculiferum, Strain PAER-2" /LENGTH=52 /DNA_ID=CAMNT_0025587937 /DNA_START=29 /DNA_END=183 /DNA_ORIENTATION=-